MAGTIASIPKDVWREHIAPSALEEEERRAFKKAVEKEADERVLAVVNDWRGDHYTTCCKGSDNPPISYEADFYGCAMCDCDLPYRWYNDFPLKDRCCADCKKSDPWECECSYINYGGTHCGYLHCIILRRETSPTACTGSGCPGPHESKDRSS